MDWIYVIGPAMGALIGGIYGSMLGSGAFYRMMGSGLSRITGSPGWTTGYMVMGALWGISLAFAYRQMHKKGDNTTGEFLTDMKETKKRWYKKGKNKKSDERSACGRVGRFRIQSSQRQVERLAAFSCLCYNELW